MAYPLCVMPPMILAIDIGNTRLKWGVWDGPDAGIRAPGALEHAELDRLNDVWRDLASPSAIAIASVAGSSVNERVGAALARFAVAPKWLASPARACGITNRYENPAQLGIDRFAALVAAHARHRGECLVVTAGTATTIDVLAADGIFRGGLILPGLELMKRALAENTAGLPLARGTFRAEPRNTADAIESGCLHAQAGAIERMRAQLGREARCFMTGGAVEVIAPMLGFSATIVEHLVLEGVGRLAA